MTIRITGLTSTSPEIADEFAIEDVSENETRKTTISSTLSMLGIEFSSVAGLGSAATANIFKFATDGRKAGEGVGAGTGILVRSDGTNWRTVDTAGIVSA